MADVLDDRILKQIKFYFSDANLLHDKFLKGKISEDNGWVSIECLLTFNRLKKLTEDCKKIIESLKNDDTHFFEVDESSAKIRRNPTNPPPALSFRKFLDEQRDNIYYIENLPSDYTLDKIEELLIQHDIKTKYIKLLQNTDKSFSGTVYCVLDCQSEAIVKLSGTIINEKEIVIKSQSERAHEISDKGLVTDLKRKSKEPKQKKYKPKYPINALLRLSNVPTDLKAKSVKETLSQWILPKWVDFSNTDTLIVQFREEGDAIKVMEHLDPSEKKLTVEGHELGVDLVTGDDELAYWSNFDFYQKKY